MTLPRFPLVPLFAVSLLLVCTGSASAQNQTVSIRATDPVAVEKNSTTVSDGAQFEISRAGSAAEDLVVGLTAGGNAVLATDFTVVPAGATTSVTIPSGKASVVVAVTPVDNSTQQDERTLTLTVAPGAGYAVGEDASASVRLLDMDKAGSSTFTGNADLFYSYKVYTTPMPARPQGSPFRPIAGSRCRSCEWRRMARWAYDNGVAFYSANNWNMTLSFLSVLASASSHPEVANAMLIGIGTSSGATGACQMADKNTSRLVYVMGITGASAKYSPSLTTHAEFDDAYVCQRRQSFGL